MSQTTEGGGEKTPVVTENTTTSFCRQHNDPLEVTHSAVSHSQAGLGHGPWTWFRTEAERGQEPHIIFGLFLLNYFYRFSGVLVYSQGIPHTTT